MNPFMLAVEKGLTHLNVAKAMMKKDPGLLSLQMGSGLTVIQWALEKDHPNAFFKVSFRSCQFSCTCQLVRFVNPPTASYFWSSLVKHMINQAV